MPRPKLPRAPLPRQTGGPHRDKRRGARVSERVGYRCETCHEMPVGMLTTTFVAGRFVRQCPDCIKKEIE